MSDELYSLNEWITIACVIVLFIIATEIGFVYGIRKREAVDDPVRNQVTTIQAAVLGLLALLLGFSFSMAMIRYDERKQLVLDEASAIGTCILRAQILQEPFRGEISRLLTDYVSVRIAFYRAGLDETKIREATEATDRLQNAIWKCTIKVGQDDPRSVVNALFIQEVNDMMDYEAKRLAALENHVPQGIFILLYLAGIMSMGLVGYGFGLGGKRNLLTTILASIFVASVILLVIDLDRPRRGMLQVGQQSLLDLQQRLKKFTEY